MYLLKKFHSKNFEKMDTIINSFYNYATGYINLVGSASLPFPEINRIAQIPATICRVEGHLHARLFPLTEPIDLAESFIKEAIYKLFKLNDDYEVSGQLHSATQANHAIYRALLKSGDHVMSLDLKDGGHISHKLGLPENIIHHSFPIDSDYNIDYLKLADYVKSIKPKLIIGGGTSFPLEVNFKELKEIAKSVDAYLMADLAHIAPFIMSKKHINAFPYADIVTIDTSKSLRGPRGAILVFKNYIAKEVYHAIFPLEQSSPNQNGILEKACCLNCWLHQDVNLYTDKLLNFSKILIEVFQDRGLNIAFNKTDTHLVILDLSNLRTTGQDVENLLLEHNILVNRNQIPNDQKSPWITSGIRLSTTSLVILDYSLNDIRILANSISDIILEKKINNIEVKYLIEKYHHKIVSISNE